MSLRGPTPQALRRAQSASCDGTDGTDGTDGQQKCPSIFFILCGKFEKVYIILLSRDLKNKKVVHHSPALRARRKACGAGPRRDIVDA